MDDDGQPAFMMDGWDLQFQTSDKGFFKTSEVYGILSLEMRLPQNSTSITETFILSSSVSPTLSALMPDREVEIIHHLRIKILTYSTDLMEMSRVLAEFDWYNSLDSLS